MNKKGFTLIELLAVIIILSLLMILVLPKITNAVKNYTKKTDALMLSMIEDAAKLYVDDNPDDFEENSYGYYCVPLTELVENDYLKEGIEISGEDVTSIKSLKIDYTNDYKMDLVDSNECIILDPGLYDEDDVLLASWDELIEAGLDVENGMNELLQEYVSSYKLVIDVSVTSIGDNAFDACWGLMSIIIPNSVIGIGGNAFAGCTGLTSITIPRSVTTIGENAFVDSTNLTSIYYSGTATGAPWGATNATIYPNE